MILFDDQAELLTRTGQAMRRHRRVCMQAPTGSGKTVLMSEMGHRFINVGKVPLYLAPRRELVYQLQGTLERYGRYFGLIMAGEERISGDGYIASFDTLHARRGRMGLPHADVVFVDEAHLALAETRRDIIACYPEAHILGVTATPMRPNGGGLGEMFEELVPGPSIADLTRLGRLVPMRYFAGKAKPDLHQVKISGGDYNQGELEEKMDSARLVGDIVTNWLEHAGGRQTIAFCSGVKHSRHVAEMFNAAGVPAEHVDGNTPNLERAAILKRLETGETRVLCSVYVTSYGFDCPPVSCIIMARPTKSKVLWFQSVGRGLRAHPGKRDCLLLDHANAVEEHGFIDERFEWSLEPKPAKDLEREKRERKEPKPIECLGCGTIFKATHICPSCGREIKGGHKAVPYWDVDLEEIGRDRKRLNRELPTEEKRAFFQELLGHARSKGYSSGWASHKYKERFGVWPNAHKGAEPRAPGESTRRYIQHLNIKRSKELKRG